MMKFLISAARFSVMWKEAMWKYELVFLCEDLVSTNCTHCQSYRVYFVGQGESLWFHDSFKINFLKLITLPDFFFPATPSLIGQRMNVPLLLSSNQRLLQTPASSGFEHERGFFHGSASFAPSFRDEFKRRFCMNIIHLQSVSTSKRILYFREANFSRHECLSISSRAQVHISKYSEGHIRFFSPAAARILLNSWP